MTQCLHNPAVTIVTGETKARINGKRCYFGSVIGYVLKCNAENNWSQYHRDPYEAHTEALERGHQTRWVSLSATCLFGDRHAAERDAAEWAGAVTLSIGDLVRFDGRLYKIAPDHNGNFKLVEEV